MSEFTVVVPVYKVEEYLAQCVDSILAQTYADFELILVDDGSPDGCPVLCDEYAKKDPRIRVIHRANGGLAAARKTGLDAVASEYVAFVDSDDWVLPNWLETIKGHIDAHNRPDIVLFGHQRDTGPSRYAIGAAEGYYDKARLAAEVYPYMICDFASPSRQVPAFIWARVGRRQLLIDHYVQASSGVTLFEDIAMAYECMYHAQSMYVTHEPLYVYRLREGSLLNDYRPRYFQEVQTCFRYLRRRMGGLEPAIDRQINGAYMRMVITAIATECAHQGSLSAAARNTGRAMRATGIPGDLSFDGLPAYMKAFLVLLKCRLWPAAAALVRLRMD